MLKINEVDELVFILNYEKKSNFKLFKILLHKLFKNKIKDLKWSSSKNFLMDLDLVFKNYYLNNVFDSHIRKMYIFKNDIQQWFYNPNDIAFNEKDILNFLRVGKFNKTCYIFLIDNNVKIFKFENSKLKRINFLLKEKQKKILKIKKLKI